MSTVKRDVQNEYASIANPRKIKGERWRQCNKCDETMSRKIPTLVNHSNKCYGYIKYAATGDLIKSKDDGHCHWKSHTSPSPAPSSDDMIIEEMKMLNDSNDPKIQNMTVYKNKKRKLDHLNSKYDYNQNEIYSSGLITTYLNKPLPPQSGTEMDKSHKDWVQFFTVCGVPYALIQHPLFKKACKSLRPSYQPPSVKVAKTKYVKLLTKDNYDELKSVLNNEKVWVQCDGSENGARNGVNHIIVVGDFGVRLVAVIYHEAGKSITAAVLMEDLKSTKLALLKSHGIIILFGGYLHDNELKEKLLAKQFEITFKRPSAGCGPHGFNKIMDYIFQYDECYHIYLTSNKLIKLINKGKIRGIVEENIIKTRIRKQLLRSDKTKSICSNVEVLENMVEERYKKNNQRVGFPDPGNTRKWVNQTYILQFQLHNKGDIIMLKDQEKAQRHLSDELREILLDDDFWDESQDLFTKIEPIFSANKSAQSHNQNLSDIYYAYHTLLPSFYGSDPEAHVFLDAIKKGWKLIKGNGHTLSVSLDPRFDDDVTVSLDQLSEVNKFFKMILGDDKFMESKDIIIDFRTKSGAFGHDIFRDCKPMDTKYAAIKAWRFYKSTLDIAATAKKELCDEIIFILRSRTGISDTEKTFCGYSRFHDKFSYNKGNELLTHQIMDSTNWKFKNDL